MSPIKTTHFRIGLKIEGRSDASVEDQAGR